MLLSRNGVFSCLALLFFVWFRLVVSCLVCASFVVPVLAYSNAGWVSACMFLSFSLIFFYCLRVQAYGDTKLAWRIEKWEKAEKRRLRNLKEEAGEGRTWKRRSADSASTKDAKGERTETRAAQQEVAGNIARSFEVFFDRRFSWPEHGCKGIKTKVDDRGEQDMWDVEEWQGESMERAV